MLNYNTSIREEVMDMLCGRCFCGFDFRCRLALLLNKKLKPIFNNQNRVIILSSTIECCCF